MDRTLNALKRPQDSFFDCWTDRHKKLIYWLLIILVILLLVVFPLLTTTIHPGQGGVYYNRLMGGTDRTHTYREGIHLVLPWNRMYVYNLRLQEVSLEVNALSLGGLRTDLEVSVVFRPVSAELPDLHVRVGEDYVDKLVIPTVKSVSRYIMTYYDPGTIYGASPAAELEASAGLLQSKIFDAVQESLLLKHIHVESIFIKQIKLPDFVEEAINKKYMAEQEYLRYRYILAKTKEALKVGYIRAETARLSAEVLSESLTPPYLRYLGIQATRELAASENAKVVLIGGEDGLPLILNMGDAAPAVDRAAAITSSEPPVSGETLMGPALDDLKKELEEINSYKRIRPLLNEMDDNIPDQGGAVLPTIIFREEPRELH